MSPKTSHDETEQLITRLVRHAGYTQPTPLQSAVVPLFMEGKDLVVESKRGEGRTGAMVIPLLAKLDRKHDSTIRAIILTGSPEDVHHIADQYRRFAPRTGHRPVLATVGRETSVRKEIRTLKKQVDILVGTPDRIIDHIRRDNILLSDVEYSILDVPDDMEARGFDKDVQFIYSKMRGKQQTVAFLADPHVAPAFESLVKRPQSVFRSDWNQAALESTQQEADMGNEDRVRNMIQGLIKRLKEAENPEILNHYRKLFRKNVPLHLRGYVAGMLLKDFLGESEEESGATKTLFVSIGKNRKVFPNDLSKLFTEALGIEPSTIGNIKILDSYSFIDVPENQANRAIELLNETEFRGRTITVNHARKKRKK